MKKETIKLSKFSSAVINKKYITIYTCFGLCDNVTKKQISMSDFKKIAKYLEVKK